MFGNKQRRIKELEEKINGYVAREIRYRDVLDAKETRIAELKEEIAKYRTDITNCNKTTADLLNKLDEFKKMEISLKQLRAEKKMTKTQVAKEMKVSSFYHLTQLEKGKANPSLEYICRLAKVYQVTPAQIVECIEITRKGEKKCQKK